MKRIEVPIKGMHCRSCEILVGEKLKEIRGVRRVHVSYRNKIAEIYTEHFINEKYIQRAVNEAGYEVGIEEKKSFFSNDPTAYRELLVSVIILALFYLIARRAGIHFNTGFSANSGGLGVVLLIGLTAGISTCMALVGGLVLGISARHAEKHPEATPAQRFRPHIFFNIGRIISYFILGGVIGLIGKAFQFSGVSLGVLTIIVGIVMLIVGLQLVEIFPRLATLSVSMPASISRILGVKKHHEKEYSHTNSMIIGALTFFLPCGFTQAMQLYAMTTGSFLMGGLIMGVFALGTAPGLLGVGGLTSLMRGAFAKKFFHFVGVVVVVLALFNMSNGFNLAGMNFSNLGGGSQSVQAKGQDPNVKLENGVQVVRMEQTWNGYEPNQFTIVKGIPVKWIVNSVNQNTCAASIYSTKLGIKKILSPGENVFEFTPKEKGTIQFTCSMGMFKGSFNVIDKGGQGGNQVGSAPNNPTNNNSGSSGGCGGCGGGARPQQTIGPAVTPTTDTSGVQLIETTYTSSKDISPNNFSVQANKPVKLIIDAQDNGSGCMGSIGVLGLTNNFQFLEKGKKITFEFTPQKGEYKITCAMGIPRGEITAS